MLNSILKLEIFFETIVQIVENISSAPGIEKFRTLKYSNAFINGKIIEVSGGVDFLHGIGFRSFTDTEIGKFLRLDFEHATGTDNDTIENLHIGVKWLTNTISTCRLCSYSVARAGKDSCSECTIVIRLPTGASVSGGFMRGDKLYHVRSFACCYFIKERYVVLFIFCKFCSF